VKSDAKELSHGLGHFWRGFPSGWRGFPSGREGFPFWREGLKTRKPYDWMVAVARRFLEIMEENGL